MKQRRIIYIIGAGRSGSTLLDILLGNAVGVESCGELNRYAKRRGIPPRCNRDSEKYRFWKRILDCLSVSLEELKALDKISDSVEYHTGFIKKRLGFLPAAIVEKYKAFQKRLYAGLFKNLPEHIHTVVDSSKYPGRAVMLSETLSCEIAYIFLKRDPVSVVRSFAKKDIEQPSKHWLPANFYYFIVNLLCRLAMSKLKLRHKTVELSYEEVVNEPADALRKIEDKLDLDLSSVILMVGRGQPLQVGRLFDGNRIRLQKELSLKTAEKITIKMPVDLFTRGFNVLIYKPPK